MCDESKIKHELEMISREVGDISNYGSWAKVIIIKLQQMGVERLADLTVAQLLRVIADAEQMMAEMDVLTDMPEVQHAN